jgi:hypothetical protein
MVENKGYVPSLTEWDELVLLWNRSRTVMASTLAPSVKARIAWTAKQFVDAHPQAPGRLVYAWLESNLEIAAGSAPISSEALVGTRWHDEPTAEHKRAARGTPYEHIKDHSTSKPVVARSQGGDRS